MATQKTKANRDLFFVKLARRLGSVEAWEDETL